MKNFKNILEDICYKKKKTRPYIHKLILSFLFFKKIYKKSRVSPGLHQVIKITG